MISFIVAMTENRVMAKNGKLPWEIPTDKTYYRAKVHGHPVIVGSTTFPQLSPGLTDREMIVLSRDPNYHAPGARIVHSPEEAMQYVDPEEETFVIGGGQVFAALLSYADRLYITEIDTELDGDVFFPEFDHAQWREVSREHHAKNSQDQYDFDFVIYDRIKN